MGRQDDDGNEPQESNWREAINDQDNQEGASSIIETVIDVVRDHLHGR
jgi:hypothetical protein